MFGCQDALTVHIRDGAYGEDEDPRRVQDHRPYWYVNIEKTIPCCRFVLRSIKLVIERNTYYIYIYYHFKMYCY